MLFCHIFPHSRVTYVPKPYGAARCRNNLKNAIFGKKQKNAIFLLTYRRFKIKIYNREKSFKEECV